MMNERDIRRWAKPRRPTPDVFGCLLISLFLGVCWGLAAGSAVLIYRVMT